MDSSNLRIRPHAELDLGVSYRQAFGTNYAKNAHTEKRLQAYWSGKLVLPPQPTWEGDPTNWTANPFSDNNWRFQHHSLRWLNPLRWAALAGDEKARQEWVRVVKSWAEANMPAAKSESDFAWRDMVDGNRAIEISLGAPLVSSDQGWYLDLLTYHRDWLMDSANIVGKNHGMHQHAGLLVLGAVLRDEGAKRTAVERITEQFYSAFDHQGTNDEGSVVYHQHNLIWWSQIWRRVEAEGINSPEDVEKRLELANVALAHLSLPDGQLPQIGDGSRVKLKARLGEATDFVFSGGKRGSAPSENCLVLDRGYIVSRSGWGKNRNLEEESHLIARHGEDLKSHSHNDLGSVHIYSKGQRWLVDSGFHNYDNQSSINNYLVSRDAHNVVTIDGRVYENGTSVELLRSKVTDELHDFTLLDTGYENVSLYRRIFYVVDADCWIISDRAIAGDPLQIIQNWLVEPGVTPRVRDHGFRLSTKETDFGMHWLGRNVKLSLTRADTDSPNGWIGTQWKQLEPSVRVTAKSSARQPHLVVLLSPSNENVLSIIDSRLSIDDNIFIDFARGAQRWQFQCIDGDPLLKKTSA